MTPADQARIEANIQNMRSKGAPEADVEAYVKSELSSTDDDGPTNQANLKANQSLGFLNGGAQAFNNALHWGSGALQSMGVPASAVHAAGSVIRDPLDVGNDAIRATGINPNQRNILAPLPNQAQIDQLNNEAAAKGQRPGTAGKIAGQVVSAIPLGVAAAPLTGAAATAGGVDAAGALLSPAANYAARLGTAALEGGANGALNADDPNNGGQVLGDAGLGAL